MALCAFISQERLEAVFLGKPFDLLDAALTDTVASFPVDGVRCGVAR